MKKQREATDPAERARDFEQIAQAEAKDKPIVYLFHRHWLWAYTGKLSGFKPMPDGLVRLQGLSL
jgi:peptide/nickel transport system substrate-binding protein